MSTLITEAERCYLAMVLDRPDLAVYAVTSLADGDHPDPDTPRLNARHAEHYQKLFDTPWPDQAVAAIAPETATRTGYEELLVAARLARTDTDHKTGITTAKTLFTEDIKASLTAERHAPNSADRAVSPASVFHHANQIDPHVPPKPQHHQGLAGDSR